MMIDVGDYETGKTRIMSEKCATCIMRPPAARIALDAGRLREFIDEARKAGTFVVCHSTLPAVAPPGVRPAVCRGFADAYDTPTLRMIRTLWGFIEVPPPGIERTP